MMKIQPVLEEPEAHPQYVDTWFMTELVLQSSGERMSFSINNSGSIDYLYGKNEIGALLQKGEEKSSSELKI